MVDKVTEIAKNPIVLLLILLLCGGGGGYGVGTIAARSSIEDVKRDNAILQERLLNACNAITEMKEGFKKLDMVNDNVSSMKIDVEVLKKQYEELKRLFKLGMNLEKVAKPICKKENDDGRMLQMLDIN